MNKISDTLPIVLFMLVICLNPTIGGLLMVIASELVLLAGLALINKTEGE